MHKAVVFSWFAVAIYAHAFTLDPVADDLSPVAFGREVVYHPKSPHNVFNADQLPCVETPRPPLHSVALSKTDHPGSIRILVTQLNINVNIRAFQCGRGVGVTPIMAAAAKGNFKIVQELANLGADLSLVDTNGHTADKIAKYWLDVSSVNQTERYQQVWQFLANRRAMYHIDDGLRQHIFDIEVTAIRCEDKSPLHAEAIRDVSLPIRGMVRNLGYVVDRRGFKCGGIGVTPLMVAASKGSPIAARELLELGADMSLVDDNGDTAMAIANHWAATKSDDERARRCYKVAEVFHWFTTLNAHERETIYIRSGAVQPNSTENALNATDTAQITTLPDTAEAVMLETTTKTRMYGKGAMYSVL